ncbi:response regulator transcription factor [Oceanospirillum beijerinckii]|uniref:response regulator transcription factor n=1 Tax=Oceanospirillum beijerinckii TaxID=64976 RepID=UPI0004107295|nr:response regulator [Oceanospirillum beijerinckii]MAC45971.1 DNA-binding response regulator [Oceanospirillum sp.]
MSENVLTSNSQTIYVVDDDQDVRESLKWLLESVGLQVSCYDTAMAFFEQYPKDAAGCIVMDVRMPGMSGISAQKKLADHHIDLPVIMISAHGNIDMAVTAMTQGAVTFIEKPFDDQTLIDYVQAALDKDAKRRIKQQELSGKQAHYDSLTKRERQVFELVVKGLSNQEMADELGINKKTVEGHRAHMMAKMEAGSLPELIHIALSLGLISSLD